MKWVRCPNSDCETPEKEWSENTIIDLGMCFNCWKKQNEQKSIKIVKKRKINKEIKRADWGNDEGE